MKSSRSGVGVRTNCIDRGPFSSRPSHAQVGGLGEENAQLRVDNDDLRQQLDQVLNEGDMRGDRAVAEALQARQEVAARDATITGLRAALRTAEGTIATLQDNIADLVAQFAAIPALPAGLDSLINRIAYDAIGRVLDNIFGRSECRVWGTDGWVHKIELARETRAVGRYTDTYF